MRDISDDKKINKLDLSSFIKNGKQFFTVNDLPSSFSCRQTGPAGRQTIFYTGNLGTDVRPHVQYKLSWKLQSNHIGLSMIPT